MRHVIREPRDFRVFVECFMPELMEHAAQLGVTVRASGVGEDGRGGIDKDDGVGEEEGIARRSILRLPTVSDRSVCAVCMFAFHVQTQTHAHARKERLTHTRYIFYPPLLLCQCVRVCLTPCVSRVMQL